MVLPMDDKIKEKIHSLVSQGVYTLAEMRRHVTDFAMTEFRDIKPSRWNTRYFPTDRDIKNHIQLAIAATW